MARFYLIGFTVLLMFDTVAQCSFKLAAEHAQPLAMSIEFKELLTLYRIIGMLLITAGVIFVGLS